MITIEHIGNSSLSGTRQEFDRARVRLGRKPDCDVRFDAARDLSVSGAHAELRQEGGRIWLRDLGSMNGTWVQGVKIQGEVELRAGDVVRLGQNGPEMRIGGDPAAGSTVAEMPAAGFAAGPGKRTIGVETLGREIHKASLAERSKTRRVLLFGGAGVITAIGVVSVWQATRQSEIGEQVEEAQARASRTAERVEQLDAEVRAGLERSLADLRSAHAAELSEISGKISAGETRVASLIVEIEDRDRALRELDSKTDQAVAGKDALALQMEGDLSRLRDQLARAENELRTQIESSTEWADLVERYKESIFLCLVQTKPDAEGNWAQAIGTAWVCRDDGLLATNAHVAEMFEDAKWSVKVAVQNHTGRTFAVDKVVKHSGWTGDPSGPDVGLIRIKDEGQSFTPLPMAEEPRLRSLRIGTRLGTIGYPGELMFDYTAEVEATGELKHAQATFKDGWIGRILDYAGKHGAFEENQRLQHSASLTGGTSGSPMFTHDGQVVALNNSGLDLHVKVQGGASEAVERMANPAQIGFAVRVDVLRELIRDSGW